jgi:putative ABC transport system ATP-binding protein|tara:strand:+ start:2577 stop:3260 length:684 start_codon:yes stop_codon:yes gene_type:complete
MNEPFIQASGLTKKYFKGEIEVTPLEELDLFVQKSEFVALMGPSGSGKTTLLNLLAGVDSPTSGTLQVDGADLHDMSREQLTRWRAKKVGYVFQLYHLMPVLTAFENVELPLLLHPMSKSERRERVESVMAEVGLLDRADHRPSELSGGQEQRVAIARALVANPSLIVADEPTGDLDRESADGILDLLHNLSENQGKTVVMVTHDPKAADRATRRLELEKGKLLATT